MLKKDKYVVFNNTGRNVSIEILLPIDIDPTTLSHYKRRKYLSSKRVPLFVPRSTSVDLVDLTGMSCKELDDNKDLQEKLRLLGPEFKIVEKTFVYSFDEEKYLELEEFADPNFRYVEPDIEDDFEAFMESIPEPREVKEESLEEKAERLRKEADDELKARWKKDSEKKPTAKKKTTKKKTTKKTTTKKKTTKKTTASRNLTKEGSKIKEE